MLTVPRYGGSRCIYCDFHASLRSLEARRFRSSGAAKRLHGGSPGGDYAAGPKVTYYKAGQRYGDSYEGSRRRANHAGKIGDGGLVKKIFSKNFDQWGLENSKKGRPQEKESYGDALRRRLNALREELKDAPVLAFLKQERADAGAKPDSFAKIWKTFSQRAVAEGPESTATTPWTVERGGTDARAVGAGLRDAYRMRGQKGLDDRIRYAFYEYITNARFTDTDLKNQRTLADLRYPAEWFPATRAMQRTVHLHVGPTNSGKTYQALQRLEQADRGVYAGPLRLLAHEVYTRMNAKGRPCSLVTGEERRSPEHAAKAGNLDMSACTVEMMPLNKSLDVAVIDEIQMIGNAERGWAWTQALLGVKAAELHLCGEERTVPLVRELCASVGDRLEIHRYERLSPLKMAEGSLDGDLKCLRKGDCIVSFSVMGIHALRRQIEKQTGRKVATVYGSLPPETRAQQARLFNDPYNDYDFLVASDAVGMGLNLAIKRIIFEASSKFDGYQRRTLPIADIKQIAGRAGRYRTAHQVNQQAESKQDLAAAKGDGPSEAGDADGKAEESVGLVTTLERFDYPVVAAAMASEPEPIRTAGLFPPAAVLERFATYFPPGTPFSYILMRLHELSQTHSRFHLCGLAEQVWIADLIEPIKGLTIGDRNVICSTPASKNDDMWKTLMPALARCIAEQSGGNLVDIRELPLEILEAPMSASREYLRSLEMLHKGIVAYLWLSYRFAGIFTTRALAFHAKGLVEEKIEEVLSKFSFSENVRRKVAEARQKQLLRDLFEPPSEPQSTAAADTAESLNYGADSMARQETPLAHQTSLTAGGDHFSGEDELELGDLEAAEVGDVEPPATSSFAEWRQQQVRGESQASMEEDWEIPTLQANNRNIPVSRTFSPGGQQDDCHHQPQQGERVSTSTKTPSVADAMSKAAEGACEPSNASRASPGHAPLPPKPEWNTGQLLAETQSEPPRAVENRPIDVSPQ